MTDILIQSITAKAFADFGDLIDCAGAPDQIINQGLCGRYHDRATFDFSGGHAGLSLFRAKPRALPLALEMMERHPLGSQAFVPMSMHPFLVIVAEDDAGKPGLPLAFETMAGQAINVHRNVWHGVLTPLHEPGLFAVIDRIGPQTDTNQGTNDNLEEFWFEQSYRIIREG